MYRGRKKFVRAEIGVEKFPRNVYRESGAPAATDMISHAHGWGCGLD